MAQIFNFLHSKTSIFYWASSVNFDCNPKIWTSCSIELNPYWFRYTTVSQHQSCLNPTFETYQQDSDHIVNGEQYVIKLNYALLYKSIIWACDTMWNQTLPYLSWQIRTNCDIRQIAASNDTILNIPWSLWPSYSWDRVDWNHILGQTPILSLIGWFS